MACRTNRRKIKKMPIGGIISAAQTGRQIGAAEKQKIEVTDAQGNLENRNKVETGFVVGSQLDPLSTLQSEHLTTGEKLGMVATSPAGGFGSLITKNRYASRLEQAAQTEAIAKRRSRLEGSGVPTQFSAPLMPLGGLIPYNEETVELEKGEPFMTPDGQIDKIADGAPSHAQGGVSITLPSGTKVLGKKPATDEKTFKQLGSKLEKQQTKYQKILDDKPTRIEEETSTRMLAKVNKEFNKLFEVQGEDTQANQQFPDGGIITTERGVSAPSYRNITPKTFEQQLLRKQILQPGYDTLSAPQINEQIRQGYNIPEGLALPYQAIEGNDGVTYQKDFGRNVGEIYDPSGTGDVIDTYNKPRTEFSRGGTVRKGNEGLLAGDVRRFQRYANIDQDNIYGPKTEEAFGVLGNDFYGVNTIQPKSGVIPTNFAPGLAKSTTRQYNLDGAGLSNGQTPQVGSPNRGGFNASSALSTAGALAPVAYNLYQGFQKPEQSETNAFRNPYESEVRATMRNRRYNIYPEIEEARLAEATYARRLREGAPTQAQYLGGLQAGAIGSQRQIGQALARKQNIENQYLSEQTRTDLALGQADAERQRYIEDINARSRAAQRQFTSQGLSQLGQYAQVKEQQNNQMIRDAQRLNLLPSLVQNFQFNSDGTWTFKKTGEVMDPNEVWDFVQGTNINR